jgi:hypothetical protein
MALKTPSAYWRGGDWLPHTLYALRVNQNLEWKWAKPAAWTILTGQRHAGLFRGVSSAWLYQQIGRLAVCLRII